MRAAIAVAVCIAVGGLWTAVVAPGPAGAMPVVVAASFPVPPIVPPPIANPLPAVGDVVGGLAKDSADTVLDAVSTWVAAGAASLLGGLARAIDENTDPQDTEQWFDGHYGLMAAVAAQLAIPLLAAVAITAVVRRDLALLLRAAFVQAPLAVLGTAAAIAIVVIALTATDELCSYVTSSAHIDAAGLLRNLTVALSRGGPGVTGFGLVLVSLLIAMGGFFLTIELVVREAAIWVAMLFLPLGLIASVWPATARWGRRLAELLVALILSKFVIVAIVSMAVSATSAGLSAPDLGPLFGGAALLLLAAAAPFTLLRMVPVIEASAVSHLEGAGRRAASPPAALQQLAHQTAQSQIARMLELRTSGAGPPEGPPIVVGGEPASTAVPTRGRDMDGTQSGPDKPEPAGPDPRPVGPPQPPPGTGASGVANASGGVGLQAGGAGTAAAGGAIVV